MLSEVFSSINRKTHLPEKIFRTCGIKMALKYLIVHNFDPLNTRLDAVEATLKSCVSTVPENTFKSKLATQYVNLLMKSCRQQLS